MWTVTFDVLPKFAIRFKITGYFISENIVDGSWKCRNLVRKCGNIDRNIEIYFRNVEMSQEIFGN